MNTQPVNISIGNGTLTANTPYNSIFIEKAKTLGGKFIGGTWQFDGRDEGRVRSLCRDVYGNDGITADTCTVRVVFSSDDYQRAGPISIGGRSIAKASGRDSGATLCDGVLAIEGGFTSGGSRANWTTEVKGDKAVVLIRDFPRGRAQKLIDAGKDWISIEIEAPFVDKEALASERDRLLARLAQIELILAPAQAALF